MATTEVPQYKKKDFASDQEVRWCPGCGDYSILNAVQTVFARLGIPREKFVVVSGIGCSSRFPYYMNTYGMHTVHGRAPGIASGVKLANPDLSVWVVTGDGDALAIGGNHFIHALRRNIDIKILLFNNRIYGLTKGQASPTSPRGKRTASTPFGVLDPPFNPISVALGVGATFVARTVDRFGKHLQEVLERAARHKGSALVEIYQNCVIFNQGAYDYLTDKEGRYEHALYLEHGKPLRFGKDLEKGIRLNRWRPEVVRVDEVGEDELLVHDEKSPSPAEAFLLAQMDYPEFPVPLGVFRDVEAPSLEEEMVHQTEEIRQKTHEDLLDLLRGKNHWEVK